MRDGDHARSPHTRAAMTAELCVGARAVCSGLVARADINGKIATVASWDAKRERWNVYVDGEPKKLALKKENLVPVMDAEDGGEGEAADGRELVCVVGGGAPPRAAAVIARRPSGGLRVEWVESNN